MCAWRLLLSRSQCNFLHRRIPIAPGARRYVCTLCVPGREAAVPGVGAGGEEAACEGLVSWGHREVTRSRVKEGGAWSKAKWVSLH